MTGISNLFSVLVEVFLVEMTSDWDLKGAEESDTKGGGKKSCQKDKAVQASHVWGIVEVECRNQGGKQREIG